MSAEPPIDLLPCPLCGNAAKILDFSGFGLGGFSKGYAPYCTNDECHFGRGIQCSYSTREIACKEWNTRANPSPDMDNGELPAHVCEASPDHPNCCHKCGQMLLSEITDVILALNTNYLSAIVKESDAIPGHYYMPCRKGELYHINKLAEIISATSKPVMVDLTAGEEVIREMRGNFDSEDIAKACADAWGLKWK